MQKNYFDMNGNLIKEGTYADDKGNVFYFQRENVSLPFCGEFQRIKGYSFCYGKLVCTTFSREQTTFFKPACNGYREITKRLEDSLKSKRII